MNRIIVITLAVALTGCASVLEGRSQQITLNTNPEGANCTLTRNGETLGQVTSPGGLYVEKTKHDIHIRCTKSGYEPATFINKSEVEGATVGNILLGGGIGWAIDSASGADNKYTSPVNLTLSKK